MHTTVQAIMATDVVAIYENTQFRDIVEILRGNGVDAAPVLDSGGEVTGVVSTADLLAKEADPSAVEDEGFLFGPRRRREHRKAGGTTAGELMTSPAITVPPDTDVETAARQMYRHHIGRLVVITPGTRHLVGIVTRSDILRVYDRADEDIRRDITEQVTARWPAPNPSQIKVTVEKGQVTIEGSVTRRSQIPHLLHDIRHVEGVVSAQSHLDWETDDTLTHNYPYM